jgi:hypothetical protein
MVPVQGFFTWRQHNSSLHCLCCICFKLLWRGCYSGSTWMFLFYIWCLSMIFKITWVYSKLPFLCICRLTNGSSMLQSFFQALNLKLLAHFSMDTWYLELFGWLWTLSCWHCSVVKSQGNFWLISSRCSLLFSLSYHGGHDYSLQELVDNGKV